MMGNPVTIFLNFTFIVTPYYICLILGSILAVILSILLILLPLVLGILYLYYKIKGPKKYSSSDVSIAFFHPYCDSGGGGERVLWCGINALKRRFPSAKFIVYTGDTHVMRDQIIDKVKQRFQIENVDWMKDEENGVKFVYLYQRKWVEAQMYPRFTLLGQSLGSMYLGWEAIMKVCPDIFVDTSGYAFTLPLFKILGKCLVGCYIHYPTISTDMLSRVKSRASTYNNRSRISNSWTLSYLKLQYYKLFARMYRKAGKYSDLTMVNSSWTEDHINKLWSSSKTHKVYPPCDNKELLCIPRKFEEEQDNISTNKRINKIISLGQFRPEKDHAMQIRSMFELRKILSDTEWECVKLVLIGGCRNSDDKQRVEDLQALCKHLSVEDNVEFKVNISYNDLKQEMADGLIGLHTMWNEHFGIAVVEMMAAGLITVAHRSGGPLMDIIVEDPNIRNGFLATHDKEYAASLAHILTNTTSDSRRCIQERARDSVNRFSEKQFEIGWIRTMESLVNSIKK